MMAMGCGMNRRLRPSKTGGLARRGWAEFARRLSATCSVQLASIICLTVAFQRRSSRP
jgi:hypothetical protein